MDIIRLVGDLNRINERVLALTETVGPDDILLRTIKDVVSTLRGDTNAALHVTNMYYLAECDNINSDLTEYIQQVYRDTIEAAEWAEGLQYVEENASTASARLAARDAMRTARSIKQILEPHAG